ncbi:hypothetical protein GCM10010195_74230 [Kitasatospora griseola]|nr:hypothetical protein GCM10010195_74230 [Kitasatospora griseola]
MGQVWKAHDTRLKRTVAIKLVTALAGDGTRATEERRRLLREARTTAQLQHPHVVTLHDLGEAGTENGPVPFLVMELVAGEGLDSLLRKGPIASQDVVRWGEQICSALAEAHAAGITHRDIKPANIMVTAAGDVKVLDFGIARTTHLETTAERLTQTGFVVGSPPYMAPEQIRDAAGPRSDLYSLGCVLFEMLTGRPPFEAPDALGYLTAHLTEEPPAPSSVKPGIPQGWDALVARLLSKDPGRRHPDADALADELRAVLAQKNTPAPSGRLGALRRRASAVIVMAIILAIPAGFAYIGIYSVLVGSDVKHAQAGDCFWLDTIGNKYQTSLDGRARTEPCSLPFLAPGNKHYTVVERINTTHDVHACDHVPGAVVNDTTEWLRSYSEPIWVLCVKPL